eukprot:COSAG02_NODE_248_length_27133_cov_45.131723_14_plen_71_part_00
MGVGIGDFSPYLWSGWGVEGRYVRDEIRWNSPIRFEAKEWGIPILTDFLRDPVALYRVCTSPRGFGIDSP